MAEDVASDVIERLGLEPLEGEGGYFRFLGKFGDGAGSIYYLITKDSFSSLHLLDDDELWFFLEGGEAEQIIFDGEKKERRILSPSSRVSFVPAGMWQETKLLSGNYALFSTVMSPAYSDEIYHSPDSAVLKAFEDVKI
ncbi:MAG: cupin domain-containing protein [Spirochaetes bacterium]|uniref:Cupin domain-containing protein n=1 Tax=Candidatus Ornithospirochaeta stercoripullorum TaxID=2840899 RepID=A0A9D9E036_9SPIO|nr:cupin domain-containing protein [Candidatus Ornithospirochaeta stercoripullorum]